MTMKVTGPGGVTVNFPDGTDQSTINQVMSHVTGTGGASGTSDTLTLTTEEKSAQDALQAGQWDPTSAKKGEMGFFETIGAYANRSLEGGAQLLEHITPGATYVDWANNALADTWIGRNIFGLGPVDMPPNWDPTSLSNLLPGSSGLDEQIKARDEALQAATPKGFVRGSVPAFAGEVLSPVTAAATPAKAGAVISGAIAGGLQPVTDDPGFGATKAAQVGLGAATGAALKYGGRMAGSLTEKVMSFFARKYPDAMITKAAKEIIDRVHAGQAAGGPRMVDLMKLVNEANMRGQPMTLADVASAGENFGRGEPLRSLLGKLNRRGSLKTRAELRDFFYQRDRGVPQRLFDAIAKYINKGDQTAFETVEALLDIRSNQGKPLWDKVYQLENIWSPRLEELYSSRDARAGLQLGYHIQQNEDLAAGRPFDPWQQNILRQDGNEIVIEQGKKPNMKILQMVKQGFDALINSKESIDPTTGRLNKLGMSRVKVRKQFIEELKRLDPTRGGPGTKVPGVYERALNAWAGETSNLEAFRMGQKLFDMDPGEIRLRFGEMTDSEQEFVRLGSALKLREIIGKTGVRGDEAKRILKNQDWIKQQLSPIFRAPNEAYEFLDVILPAERTMFDVTAEATAGSQTAARLAEDNRMAANAIQAMDIAHSAARGHFHGVAMGIYRMLQRLGIEPDDKLNEAIAKLMLTRGFRADSKATQALLDELPKPVAQQVGNAIKATTGHWRTGSAAGGEVARAVGIERWHGLDYERTPDGRLVLVPGQSLTNYTPPVQ